MSESYFITKYVIDENAKRIGENLAASQLAL